MIIKDDAEHTRIRNSQYSSSSLNEKTTLQGNSIDARFRNEGVSSKDMDSQQKKETYGLQWLCNVLFGIGALVGDLPIHVKIPDGMSLPKEDFQKGYSDNPGLKGQNGSLFLDRNFPNQKPDYEDGTWMTIHIQFPQTKSARNALRTIHHQSNDGNIHEQTDITIDTNNPLHNEEGCNGTHRPNNTSGIPYHDYMK